MKQDAKVPTAIIVSGGIAHDFQQTSAELAEILTEIGFTTSTTGDVETAFAELASPSQAIRPLLVLNLLRFRLDVPRLAHFRDQWALSLSPEARAGLYSHLAAGGGVLAMHGASICFDDWPEWRDLLGASWNWDRSSHPPVSTVAVSVRTDAHPIVMGIDDFELEDEVYGFLDLADGVEGLLYSAHGGTNHPVLWTRKIGAGRIVYDALGHGVSSLQTPSHRTIVERAARWAARIDDPADSPKEELKEAPAPVAGATPTS